MQDEEAMPYLVLARKWRPQVFGQVVGQKPITQTLQNAIAQKRVPHALLFTGARGVGKTSTARILAKALNCEAGPLTDPCNQCLSCREISAGTSMDVIEIDGASNRGIDEIRELRENVRYTPAKSRYKIYIIDEVHMLTREAFNALLKTLEEPPSHIIFIFATTEPHKIPATILSRCQRYDFKRIPLKNIVEHLKHITREENVQISPRGLFHIAREAGGSMRDAQSLLDQVISYAGREIKDEDLAEVLGLMDRKLLYDTLEAIANGESRRCLEVIDHLYQYGYEAEHFCRELLEAIRNLIVLKVTKHPEALMELAEEELGELQKLADRFPYEQLNTLFGLLLKGYEEIVQSSFPRILLEMTLIRMTTLPPMLPIDDLLKRLEGLENPREEESRALEAIPDERLKEERNNELEAVQERGEGERAEHKEDPKLEGSDRPGEPQREIRPLGIPQEEREKTWKELVNFVRMKNPVLGAFLVFGDLISLREEQIEIGFEKDSFHYERMLERENLGLLERLCRDFLSKEARVVISPLEPGMRSKGKSLMEEAGAEQEERGGFSEKRGEAQYLIREALRLFNGRIVDG